MQLHMVEFQTLGFLSGTARPSSRSQTLVSNSPLFQFSARTISMISPSNATRDPIRNKISSDEVVTEADNGQTAPSSDLFARLSLILEKLSKPRFASSSSLEVGCKPIQQSPIAYNMLMKAFAQVGKVNEVLRLAHEMKDSNCNPNVYCYNTVMNALVEANKPAEAEALFEEMIADGVVPNLSSYNILVKLYSFCLKDFDAGYKVIAMMMENECSSDLTTHSTLIAGLCRDERVEEAKGYLYWMLEQKFFIDAYIYTPIVQVYCSNGKIEEAKQLMEEMESLGFVPNSVTYNVVVRALCKVGNFEEVENVLREGFSNRWEPDEITYNTYMDGLCKHGRVKCAYLKLEEMLNNGILPSKVTLNVLLDCLCHEMRFSEAIWLLDRSSELEWHPGIVGYNTVMSRLSKNGRWSVVLKLSADIMKKGIAHNTKTFNIVIDSLCRVGRVHQARCFIDNRGFVADVSTYNTLIHWLFQGGRLNEAFQMFYNMHVEKITPDLITHTIMVHGLCKEKKYMEATDYFLRSLKDEFALDVYVCLLSKLLHHGRYKEMIYLFDGMVRENQNLMSCIVFCSTISTFCRKGFCHNKRIYVVCLVLEKMLCFSTSKKF